MGKYINSITTFMLIDIIRAIKGTYDPGITNDTSKQAPHSPESLFYKLFEKNIAALRQANPAKQGGAMQGPQNSGLPLGLDDYLKMQRQGSDTFYEPYWKEGEWVFQRKPFTVRPPNYMALYTKVKPAFVEECVESCPRIYAGYGPVCGHYISITTGQLHMKQFHSLCHMLFDNCIMGRTRHGGNGQSAWRPALHGSCYTRWKKQVENPKESLKRAKEYLEALTPKQEFTTPALKVNG